MQYEGQICRAPMERAAFMLPVAVGCSYNRCKFCMLFRHLTWRVLPLDQVEAELLRVKRAGGVPKRIFLGDGNAFDLPFEHLKLILEMIRRYFPLVEGINMDATVTGISQKTEEQLNSLRELGVDCLYLGIECGVEDVLQFMNKDHTLAQAGVQIERLHTAGLSYAAHIMTGICGEGRGAKNAHALADFLNKYPPRSVTNFSVFLHRRAPLWNEIENGAFRPADELQNLREERILLEKLNVENLVYDGFHDLIETRVRGTLPYDREKMLGKLDTAIALQATLPPVYAFVE